MDSFDDIDDLAAVMAVQAVLYAVAAAVSGDGRRSKRPRTTTYTIRNNVWEGVDKCESDGWFRTHLRMNRCTFDSIVDWIETKSEQSGVSLPADNAFIDSRMAAAITLQYLSQEGGFVSTAGMFGISKAATIRSVNRIVEILYRSSAEVIKLVGYTLPNLFC
jgi:hypothetical protein